MSDLRRLASIMARSGALQKKSQPPKEEPPLTEATKPLDSWEPQHRQQLVEKALEHQPLIDTVSIDNIDTSSRASKFGSRAKPRYTILGISVSHEEKQILRTVTRRKGYRNFSNWAREALFSAAGLPIPPRREPAYEKKPRKKRQAKKKPRASLGE